MMKIKTLVVGMLLCSALVLAAIPASAAMTTITFEGADIVAPAISSNSTSTPIVGDGAIDGSGYKIATYASLTRAQNPGAFDAWLGSLDAGEGISEFNLWLQNGITEQSGWWGENIAIQDWNAAISASAPHGWTASVIANPYFTGRKMVAYWTDNPDCYLRPGIASTTFSFTADTSGIPGHDYQIWVGSGYGLAGDTNLSGSGGLINDGWSYGSTNYAAVNSFQRAVGANAAAVPEPMSIMLGIMGLASVAGLKRLKK
ncbi:MAG: hypothetical protein ACYC64_06410 [Armatimonadota bacterium]